MLVYIPEITGLDDSDDALFDCAWSSPFAGATQLGAQTDAKSYLALSTDTLQCGCRNGFEVYSR